MPSSMGTILTNSQPITVPRLARIRRALKRLGISQYEIAQQAGVTATFVWMALNDRRRSQKVIATAEALIAERVRSASAPRGGR